jgi:CelD/BcsL family acetyltransferase involved in cellulose biosynthesis
MDAFLLLFDNINEDSKIYLTTEARRTWRNTEINSKRRQRKQRLGEHGETKRLKVEEDRENRV